MTEDGGKAAGGLSFNQKTVVTLLLFGVVAVLAWQTMEPGKFRTLVFVMSGWLGAAGAVGMAAFECGYGSAVSALG